jgi:hypothetical protein
LTFMLLKMASVLSDLTVWYMLESV